MEWLEMAEKLLWSGPVLVGLMGSHVYFTLRLRGVQRHTLRGIRLSVRGQAGENGVSGFGALATALAAAIGTGNILGVATAVALGGPGAVLWCWLTGVLGMATRYAETYLTLKYRTGADGAPMHVMENRLGWRGLAAGYSLLGVLTALGMGAMLQSGAIAQVMEAEAGIPAAATGLAVCLLAAPAVLGGAAAAARICTVLAPAMAGVYLLGCGGVLWVNRAALPETAALIVKSAFSLRAAGGGAAGGMLAAARYGCARGLVTNEAGMGTGPMAAAAGPVRPIREAALADMTAVFWDTVVICGMTGLAVVSATVQAPELFRGADGAAWSGIAFSLLPGGQAMLDVSLVTFAFATVVGWQRYGEACWRHLTGGTGLFRGLYLAAAFLGALGGMEMLWSAVGVTGGLMAAANLACLWRLRREIGNV